MTSFEQPLAVHLTRIVQKVDNTNTRYLYM